MLSWPRIYYATSVSSCKLYCRVLSLTCISITGRRKVHECILVIYYISRSARAKWGHGGRIMSSYKSHLCPSISAASLHKLPQTQCSGQPHQSGLLDRFDERHDQKQKTPQPIVSHLRSWWQDNELLLFWPPRVYIEYKNLWQTLADMIFPCLNFPSSAI